jgi:hypothetical protein
LHWHSWFVVRVRRPMSGHGENNKTFLLLAKARRAWNSLPFFFGKKNGLQKFQGKFYVLAALSNCVL